MIVQLIDDLDRNEFVTLIRRLEAEQFSEACVISKIEPNGNPEERELYIKIPDSPHGVLLLAGHIDDNAIHWVVEALRLSVQLL
jgi:hypothetical protein